SRHLHRHSWRLGFRPASFRPEPDGQPDRSELSLVFGYAYPAPVAAKWYKPRRSKMSGAAKILTASLFALPLTILLSCADGSLPPSAPPGPYSFQSVVWNRWERSYFRPGRLAGCGKTRPEALLQGNFAVAACRDSKATSSFFTCWKPELCSAQGTSTSGVI